MAIHIFTQFKGGIGTTLAASHFIDYLKNSGQRVRYVDLDPIGPPSLACRPFSTETISIVDESYEEIDRSKLDAVFDKAFTHDGPTVVDVNSTVAIPFLTYMNERAAFEACKNFGIKVIFHMTLAGGRAGDRTARGIQILLENQLVPAVIWENEYFGEVRNNGKTFVQSELFSKNQHQILGVIRLSNDGSLTPHIGEEKVCSQLAKLSL